MANRTVPITVRNNPANVVGWLILSEKISDDEVLDSHQSWVFKKEDTKRHLLEMTLVPNLKVGPAMLERRFCAWSGCKAIANTGYLCDEHREQAGWD